MKKYTSPELTNEILIKTDITTASGETQDEIENETKSFTSIFNLN